MTYNATARARSPCLRARRLCPLRPSHFTFPSAVLTGRGCVFVRRFGFAATNASYTARNVASCHHPRAMLYATPRGLIRIVGGTKVRAVGEAPPHPCTHARVRARCTRFPAAGVRHRGRRHGALGGDARSWHTWGEATASTGSGQRSASATAPGLSIVCGAVARLLGPHAWNPRPPSQNRCHARTATV